MGPDNRTTHVQNGCWIGGANVRLPHRERPPVGSAKPLTAFVTARSHESDGDYVHNLMETRIMSLYASANRTKGTVLGTITRYHLYYGNTQPMCGRNVRRLKEGVTA